MRGSVGPAPSEGVCPSLPALHPAEPGAPFQKEKVSCVFPHGLSQLPSPLPDNTSSCPLWEMFIAMDLRSSLFTSSNLSLIKANVLKFVNDSLCIFF